MVNGGARATNPAPLLDLVAYLDEYLSTADVQDGPGALNGLQVENSGSVGRIVAAVDACQATIDAAVVSQADLLVVHHGLFWGAPQPVAGRQWRRIKQLITNDIAVYSSHLPLDRHPEVGNNAVFAEALGLSGTEPFGEYDGLGLARVGAGSGGQRPAYTMFLGANDMRSASSVGPMRVILPRPSLN